MDLFFTVLVALYTSIVLTPTVLLIDTGLENTFESVLLDPPGVEQRNG